MTNKTLKTSATEFYPLHGVPRILVADHGHEFSSRDLLEARHANCISAIRSPKTDLSLRTDQVQLDFLPIASTDQTKLVRPDLNCVTQHLSTPPPPTNEAK